MEENKSQIIIYQTGSGDTKLDVNFHDETVWLTQKMIKHKSFLKSFKINYYGLY